MKKIIILLSFTCACLLFTQNVLAQTEEEGSNYVRDLIKVIFSGVDTSNISDPTDPNNPGSGGVQVPPMNYEAVGLPQPNAATVTQLKSRIENNPKALWAVKSLLAAEKDVSTKGFSVIPYLTTAWIWFENGQSGWPDPYSINCNETPLLSEVASYCNSRNFQIGGYQVAAKEQQYINTYNKVHPGADVRTVMQQVAENSKNAIRNSWSYKHASQQKGLVAQYLSNGQVPTTASINDISPRSPLYSSGNQKSQFYTLLLGKDPKMIIALNSSAVSEGDLVRGLKNCDGCQKPATPQDPNNCTYRYICNTEEVLLASMVEALRQIDGAGTGGQPGQPGVSGSPVEPPADSSSILGWAEKISAQLMKSSGCWGFYCRMTTPITNGTYTIAYREGLISRGAESIGRQGLYWCTRLIIDSANLAGKKGLNNQESVTTMISYWERNKAAGYSYMKYFAANKTDKKNYLTNLRPGCALFQVTIPGIHSDGQHVAVVKNVNIKPNGDGIVTTLDSNSGLKEHKYTIDDWEIINQIYPYVSFGCFN